MDSSLEKQRAKILALLAEASHSNSSNFSNSSDSSIPIQSATIAHSALRVRDISIDGDNDTSKRPKKRQRISDMHLSNADQAQREELSVISSTIVPTLSRSQLQKWAMEYGQSYGLNGRSKSQLIRATIMKHMKQTERSKVSNSRCQDFDSERNNGLSMPTSDENSDESLMPTRLTTVASFGLKASRTITRNAQAYAQRSRRNFFKGVKFSPDGRCIVSCSDDNTLRLFEVEDALHKERPIADDRVAMITSNSIAPVLTCTESETIYDFCWYPRMSSASPQTCVFASTSRNSPVHLFDAYTGGIRATYRAYDHYDEIVSPISLCFSLDGARLYTGFPRMIRIFDTSRPGRPVSERPLCKCRSDRSGQRGIVSCMSFNPDWSGLYAVGTYARNVWIYDDRSAEPVLSFENAHAGGGITQVKWCPDGRTFCSGARTDGEIAVWDVRGGSNHSRLAVLPRKCVTNQRVAFDIDEASGGRYLVSGSSSPIVECYDLKCLHVNDGMEKHDETENTIHGHNFSLRGMEFNDAVNGVSLGQNYAEGLLATTTGQRSPNLSTWALSSSCNSSSDSESKTIEDSVSDEPNCDVSNKMQVWRLKSYVSGE